MQEISMKCDICRKTYPKDDLNEIQIGIKMHDLCRECSGKLEKVLQGTGREVPPVIKISGQQVPSDWQKQFSDWQKQFNVGEWNQPGIVLPVTTLIPVPNNQPYATSGFMTTTINPSSLDGSTGVAGSIGEAYGGLQVSMQNSNLPKAQLEKVQAESYAQNAVNALFSMSPSYFDSAGMKWKQ